MANEVKRQIVTKDGLQKMIDELEYSRTTRRTQVAEQIKVAISFGDLSENAEYDAAKNEQAALEQRIAELENTIRNAIVVDENNVSTDVVSFGNTVRIEPKHRKESLDGTVPHKRIGQAQTQHLGLEAGVGKRLEHCRGETAGDRAVFNTHKQTGIASRGLHGTGVDRLDPTHVEHARRNAALLQLLGSLDSAAHHTADRKEAHIDGAFGRAMHKARVVVDRLEMLRKRNTLRLATRETHGDGARGVDGKAQRTRQLCLVRGSQNAHVGKRAQICQVESAMVG